MKCDMIPKTAGAILYTIAGMPLIIWAFYCRDEEAGSGIHLPIIGAAIALFCQNNFHFE